MIIGVEGGLGSGKTVFVVAMLEKSQKEGKTIMSNFKLFKIKHLPLDVLSLMVQTDIKNVVIAIDEITVFVDCRKSASRMNRLISYFILQSRKKDVTLYYTTQDLSMVDKRLFRHTDIQVICGKIYDDEKNEIDDYREYTILDLRNRRKPTTTTFIWNMSQFYGYYDTNEIILPPI